MIVLVASLVFLPLSLGASSNEGAHPMTCGEVKGRYKKEGCCKNPDKVFGHEISPTGTMFTSGKSHLRMGEKLGFTKNVCEDKKVDLPNKDCIAQGINEQSGRDISSNAADGSINTLPGNGMDRWPITNPYRFGNLSSLNFSHGPLCPVNVHWHLGAEHRSEGQYDEAGAGPGRYGDITHSKTNPNKDRRLAGNLRYGYACHYYKEGEKNEQKWAEYDWQHCKNMHVGETYEVHWPHSILGACGTPFQYQSPFYDGVFCNYDSAAHFGCLTNPDCLSNAVGVQGQVFTIINDEDYFYPNLMTKWIEGGDFAQNVASYTGSTTGTSRSNTKCSQYTPITWQVDRKCHLISASSFDKMCADMKMNPGDSMVMDIEPHGARELVKNDYVSDKIHEYDPSR